jgi:hypothetical protein
MKSHGDRQQYRRRPAAPCEIADMGVEADHGEEVDEQDVARRQVEIDLDTGEEIDQPDRTTTPGLRQPRPFTAVAKIPASAG